ncbi:hypothetical protein [Sphingobacterium thalpophilum]|uniref:hypothetical protein n=1 Tax=Sphingobacterium thalpophilum TaxID=259 RepID=UPI0031DFCE0C
MMFSICKEGIFRYGEKDWMEFVFFAANVQHLLGVTDLAAQEKLYVRVNRFAHEQAAFDLNRIDFVDHTSGMPLPDEPSFILAFHFGQYRAIPAFLIQKGYRLCIPVSRLVLEQQQHYYASLLGERGCQQLLFLDAEDPQLFFKLRRHMEWGFHVFCYIDGGASALGALRSKRTAIPFLEGSIWVQQGILEMAHLLKKPMSLLAAVPAETGGKLAVELLNRCDTTCGMGREAFAGHYIQSVYLEFAGLLVQYPYAWEAWLYLHRTMHPHSDILKWQDDSRLILFKNKEHYLLLDKFSYLSYPLSCHDLVRLEV